MPSKKRGRSTGGAGGNRRGGSGSGKGGAKKGRRGSTASDQSEASSDDGSFDKSRLQNSVSKYDMEKLVTDPRFEHPEVVDAIEPEDFNMEYYLDSGFETPLLFHCDPAHLKMKMPKADEFTVESVLKLVGGNREIDIIEVDQQGASKMTLQKFVDYYQTPRGKRSTLYNVLSLEFSLTEMADYVEGPELVTQIDWAHLHWPDALRQRYVTFLKDGSYRESHTYPKVQRYCLMSVEKCYTDFHIDFGGTSVWYHVLKGQKIFFMIEPTETNIKLYEEFLKNPDQTAGIFFGDVVDKCARFVLMPGDTMMIPAGWIHAVYTPVDSLVFGGNFLHSLRGGMQIKVIQNENRISVSKKFRYPYSEELLWYVVADFVKKTTGRRYARPIPIDSSNENRDYVGKYFIAKGGHRKKITWDTYSNGKYLTEEDLLPEDMVKEKDEGSVAVIAMHSENVYKHSDFGLEDELIEEDENDTKQTEPTIHSPDPSVFYHEKSILYDFQRGTTAHKNPVGDEPPLDFDDEALARDFPERLLFELEKISDYLTKKRVAEVGEGITKPASLLGAFRAVLERRRQQLEKEKGQELSEPAPWTVKGKRKRSPAPTRRFREIPQSGPLLPQETTPVKACRASTPTDSSSARALRASRRIQAAEAAETVKTEHSDAEEQKYVPEKKYIPQHHARRHIKMDEVNMDDFILEEDGHIPYDGAKEEELHEEDHVMVMPTFEQLEEMEGVAVGSGVGVIKDRAMGRSESFPPEETSTLVDEEYQHHDDDHEYPNEHPDSLDLEQDGEERPISGGHDESSILEDSHVADEEVDVVGEENTPESKKAAREAKKNAKKAKQQEEREKRKKEREMEKERKEKEKEKAAKRRASKSFEDILGADGHGVRPKKKYDPKKDKPQFVGGLPMAPTLAESTGAANPYNYNPMQEVMKLGTGCLQSAYRKSRMNIAPPTAKNMYKLVPKTHEDGEEAAHMVAEEPTNGWKPIGSQERQSRLAEAPTPLRRASFMPRLDTTSIVEPPARRQSMNEMKFPSSYSPGSSNGTGNDRSRTSSGAEERKPSYIPHTLPTYRSAYSPTLPPVSPTISKLVVNRDERQSRYSEMEQPPIQNSSRFASPRSSTTQSSDGDNVDMKPLDPRNRHRSDSMEAIAEKKPKYMMQVANAMLARICHDLDSY